MEISREERGQEDVAGMVGHGAEADFPLEDELTMGDSKGVGAKVPMGP